MPAPSAPIVNQPQSGSRQTVRYGRRHNDPLFIDYKCMKCRRDSHIECNGELLRRYNRPVQHPTASAAETTNTTLTNLTFTLFSLLTAHSNVKPTDYYPTRSDALAEELLTPSHAPALDCATSTHMLHRLSCFQHLQPVHQAIRMANGAFMKASDTVDALLRLVNWSFALHGAYYVPDLVRDLISLFKLAKTFDI